jgi:hypothetical protein
VDHAVARYDWGRWVADCPSPTCTNAIGLAVGQKTFQCGYWVGPRPEDRVPGCGAVAPLAWPADPAAIEVELAGVPESQRHWKPEPETAPEEAE